MSAAAALARGLWHSGGGRASGEAGAEEPPAEAPDRPQAAPRSPPLSGGGDGGSRLGRARSPPPPFRDFIEAESKPWPTSPATPLPPEPSEGPDLWGAVLSFLQYGYVAVVMGLFAYFMVVIERQNEIMESMKSRIAILEVQCRHAT